MIGNAFVLAVRQISRNPLRSLLTVLGVVIGVMAVITMVTVGNGASQAIRTQIESFGNNQLMLRPGLRMGPGQSVGAPNFTLEDADALKRQIAGIVAVAPQASKTMTVVANGRNWQTSVIGTDNNYFTIDNREIVDGRTFEQGEMQSGAAVCVIGGTIQKELFGEGAEVIGRTIRTGSFSCRVVGLLKTKGTAAMGGDQDDLLVMPIKTLQRRILGKNRVGALLVSVNPQSDRDRLRDAVTELMRERRSLSDGDDDNFQILDTAEIAAKVASTTQIMTTLLAAVAAVSLLVGGIGIMNIMLVSVTERHRRPRARGAAPVPDRGADARLHGWRARRAGGSGRLEGPCGLHGRALHLQPGHQSARFHRVGPHGRGVRFLPRQTCGQARPDRGGASRVTRERSGKAERSEAHASDLSFCLLVRLPDSHEGESARLRTERRRLQAGRRGCWTSPGRSGGLAGELAGERDARRAERFRSRRPCPGCRTGGGRGAASFRR